MLPTPNSFKAPRENGAIQTFSNILMIGACVLLAATSRAADPVLRLSIPFTNAPGTTTMVSDISGGGVNITLTMRSNNAARTPVDLHGSVGSGVNGAATGIRAMDFTPTLTPSQTNQPANSSAVTINTAGNAVVASDLNDAALTGIGGANPITNFVATIWIKQNATMLNGSTIGPRVWILNAGATGVDSGGSANTLGLKFQQNNQLAFQLGTDNPTFLGTSPSGIFPNLKWLFFAIVYDGTNASMYYGTDGSTCQLIGSAATANRSINLGTAACLAIGNRDSAAQNARGFDGWFNDFRFYTGGVPTNALVFVESIRASIAPKIPTVTGVYPDGTSLLQSTNTLVFTAAAASGLNFTNISVVLNGVNVAGSCTFVTNGSPGTATNISGSYANLPQQSINTAVISATDGLGLVGSSSVSFDTFSATNFIIKAEEFDYNSGQFIDNPLYTTLADPNSYFGLDSVEGVDTHKGATAGAGNDVNDYRAVDGSGTRTQTPLAPGELPSPTRFGSNNPPTHMIGNWSSAEWENYTKTFPAGNYNVYARLSTSSGSTIRFDQVTSGQGTSSQTLNNLGSFTFTGSGNFKWVPLTSLGSLAVVNLAGASTVRATTGGGANADFYMLVPANPNLPTITQVYPDGQFLFQNTNKLAFTVSSSVTTISTANIQVTLNGSNVSSGLVFSGGPSTWNVSYTGLQPNQTYATVIQVTDANSASATATLSIDTWNPLYQLEAEAFDFDPNQSPVAGTGKRYIDNSVPTPPGIPAANSYQGQVGVQGIDEQGITAGLNSANYRPNDQVATSAVTDAARKQFNQANALDYNVGFLGPGFWQNYTRTWPTGTFNIYARLASGANIGTLHASWSTVIAGVGTSSQLTRHIGTFSIPSTNGYSSYLYAPLVDTFGNYANVTLSGSNTFRVTELTLDQSDRAAAGSFGLNANFYMLLTNRTDLPRIDNVYPDGSVLQQSTNTLSFVASSPTYGVTNVQLVLNGVNVSSNLSFSGSSGSSNVTYAALQPNKSYTAVMTVIDALNQSHTTTVNFDTFSTNHFTWEAEDFDFDPTLSPVAGTGNRYIDNPVPTTTTAAADSYYGQISGLGIDVANAFINQHPGTYIWRPSDYVVTEVGTDTARSRYLNAQLANVDPTIIDYDIAFWTNGAFINWTRTLPTGDFYAYARLAGGNGAFNLPLAQVTGGWGTTNQSSQYLGTFRGSGGSFTAWQWVQLINTNSSQPVILSLGGTNTLQMTADGNENANFFMLVPALQITPSLSPSNIILSFPTQTGFNYSIYYKNDLSDATWNLLNTVPGNGSTRSISDTRSLSKRFYRLSVQ